MDRPHAYRQSMADPKDEGGGFYTDMFKKYFIFLIALLLTVLAGCAGNEEKLLPPRTYVFEASKEVIKPSVTLEEGGKFIFFFSAISSYIGHGLYEISNNCLNLKTNDDKYHYVFSITDEKLIFNAEGSSSMIWFSDITDGAVFA